MTIETIIHACRLMIKPWEFIDTFLLRYPYLLPDKMFLQLRFRAKTGKWINFKNPRTFNEKLQWLKLYNRKHEYITLVDKYAVKKYVTDIIGEEYIIPTIGVWNHFDEIDFDKLPDQFVLKCTHDSGGLVICKDKSMLDKQAAKYKIEKSLKTDFYSLGREWPYKNVPRKIIAEPYVEDKETKELRDYKFFCFDGKVKWLFIATDRQNREEPYFDFFDIDGNYLPIKSGHPNAPTHPALPKQMKLMKQLAAKLSNGIPHVRVDFYEVDGKVYFGELTLFHHTGMVQFDPDIWNYTFGDEIVLPQKKVN